MASKEIPVEMDEPSDDVALKCAVGTIEEAGIKVLAYGFSFVEGNGYVRVAEVDYDRAMAALNLEQMEHPEDYEENVDAYGHMC
jgi:hypothetical protein